MLIAVERGLLQMRSYPTSSRSAGRRAFTLVELLVVIGIIAILIAVLMPVLARARAAGNRAVCLSNVRQLYTGILMYSQENHGWLPTAAWARDGVSFIHYPEDWIHWEANRNLDDSAVARYVGRGDRLKELLRCPSDRFDARKTLPGISAGQGPYLYSYHMNENIGRNWKPYASLGHSRITQWHAPAKKLMVTEGTVGQPVIGYTGPLAEQHGVAVFHGNVPGFPEMQKGTKHGKNVSTVFFDGHAEGIDQDFAFDPSLFLPLSQ
jgi:prepilin-type N-terminal cleavage/methylation domain-containing protein